MVIACKNFKKDEHYMPKRNFYFKKGHLALKLNKINLNKIDHRGITYFLTM